MSQQNQRQNLIFILAAILTGAVIVAGTLIYILLKTTETPSNLSSLTSSDTSVSTPDVAEAPVETSPPENIITIPADTKLQQPTSQPKANLGKNLGGVNLQNKDLRRMNLRQAQMGGANLAKSNLSGVDLSGANMGGANLSQANLTNANLSGADLRGANLSGANLKGANLDDAYTDGANFNGAILP
ncbi:pentapeptide repeat-containing protein [Calothrix sp. UHCC 0171]|uniref:pentapeptide repeat-containing protein n=1 Tax=Calothrix sp. UHCC 0171 TaxID=3110245 RepID=UPI002B2114B4|nr:pentapeptide repeat-containing protein [Calothrix sp. UHCC 0171]MEA5571474.1 pentapeptide repeat-containing protein [Calothrix sp. UHCC 0171]